MTTNDATVALVVRDRDDHLGRPIARAPMEHADRLLAGPPQILPAAVLIAKLP